MVISVPAYFDDSQRNATRDSAKMAGLNAELVDEPIATALTYCHQLKKINEQRFVKVVDIGGDSLDVSVVLLDH